MKVDASELAAMGADVTAAAGRLGAAASAVVRKSGADMQRHAQSNAPVDTGALRSSVSLDITGDGRAGLMIVEVGPTVEYGLFVETGTSRMAPQPYLSPAFDAVVPPMAEALALATGRAFGMT